MYKMRHSTNPFKDRLESAKKRFQKADGTRFGGTVKRRRYISIVIDDELDKNKEEERPKRTVEQELLLFDQSSTCHSEGSLGPVGNPYQSQRGPGLAGLNLDEVKECLALIKENENNDGAGMTKQQVATKFGVTIRTVSSWYQGWQAGHLTTTTIRETLRDVNDGGLASLDMDEVNMLLSLIKENTYRKGDGMTKREVAMELGVSQGRVKSLYRKWLHGKLRLSQDRSKLATDSSPVSADTLNQSNTDEEILSNRTLLKIKEQNDEVIKYMQLIKQKQETGMGMNKADVARKFDVGKTTVSCWYNKWMAGGSPIANVGRPPKERSSKSQEDEGKSEALPKNWDVVRRYMPLIGQFEETGSGMRKSQVARKFGVRNSSVTRWYDQWKLGTLGQKVGRPSNKRNTCNTTPVGRRSPEDSFNDTTSGPLDNVNDTMDTPSPPLNAADLATTVKQFLEQFNQFSKSFLDLAEKSLPKTFDLTAQEYICDKCCGKKVEEDPTPESVCQKPEEKAQAARVLDSPKPSPQKIRIKFGGADGEMLSMYLEDGSCYRYALHNSNKDNSLGYYNCVTCQGLAKLQERTNRSQPAVSQIIYGEGQPFSPTEHNPLCVPCPKNIKQYRPKRKRKARKVFSPPPALKRVTPYNEEYYNNTHSNYITQPIDNDDVTYEEDESAKLLRYYQTMRDANKETDDDYEWEDRGIVQSTQNIIPNVNMDHSTYYDPSLYQIKYVTNYP